MLHFMASDLGQYYLLRPVYLNSTYWILWLIHTYTWQNCQLLVSIKVSSCLFLSIFFFFTSGKVAMAGKTKRQKSSESYRFLCGTCPDEECKARLYFPSYDKSVECTSCGQRHEKSLLHDIAEVTNPEVAIHNLLKNILLGNRKPKKGADNVKVLGLSNYVCKLISPILTSYGMDRRTGKARLLKELGQDDMLNCGKILGNRAFLIEPENLDIIGYGRDRSGSLLYLADTLKDIAAFNNNETRLVPIHADGDGHCLVHAISRALVGRELFWHALRVNLGQDLRENIDKYKQLFQNFVDSNEWEDIINECDPYYIPPEGEPIGLRNIHIFGLANVLHRPIILLDSKSGMQSFGDYSGKLEELMETSSWFL